jgi:hypothetical protein
MMVQASCCSRSANWYHSRENRLCYLKEHVWLIISGKFYYLSLVIITYH